MNMILAKIMEAWILIKYTIWAFIRRVIYGKDSAERVWARFMTLYVDSDPEYQDMI